MLELGADSNLPSGVVVNHSYVTTKLGQVVVILINTTDRSIQIFEPLLAADMYEVELYPCQYYSILHREGNSIKIGFQPTVSPMVEGNLQTNEMDAEL